jgi:hypothetical protein
VTAVGLLLAAAGAALIYGGAVKGRSLGQLLAAVQQAVKGAGGG